MRAVSFDLSVPRFLLARTAGRVSESVHFGALSGLRFEERPEPEFPGPEWVRLRVLASGVCGTDVAFLTYSASPQMEPFGSFPAVPGHEILAEVEEVGPGVSRVEPGLRVSVDPVLSCRVRGYAGDAWCSSCRRGRPATCEMAGEEGELEMAGRFLSPGLTIGYHRDLPGGWAERIVAHEDQLFPVPEAVSGSAAVLTEPLAIGMHAILNSPPADGDDVFVIGSGPIALGTIWGLRAWGFEGTIVAQTKREHEAELARRMGADDVVSPGLEARQALVETGAMAYQPIVGPEVFSGGGFPLVFDCVGSASSLDQALRFTAARGRIVLLGCATEIRRIDLSFLWARELDLKGFVGYGTEEWRGRRLHTFEVVHQLLAERPGAVQELVTHVFPLTAYRRALSAAANHARSEAVKVVLEP